MGASFPEAKVELGRQCDRHTHSSLRVCKAPLPPHQARGAPGFRWLYRRGFWRANIGRQSFLARQYRSPVVSGAPISVASRFWRANIGRQSFLARQHRSPVVLPVPIPNTEVKPSRADGTARSACGRVGRCRNSSQDAPPLTTSRGASLFAELVEAPDYKINAEARRRGDLFQTNPPRLRASAFVFDSSSTVPSCTAIGNRVNSIT